MKRNLIELDTYLCVEGRDFVLKNTCICVYVNRR